MKICTATGFLTRDPVKQRNGDNAFGTLKTTTIGPNGVVQPEFVDLVFPGKFAERIMARGRQGAALTVSGTEHLKEFKGRNGPGKVNEIYVTSLELGGE